MQDFKKGGARSSLNTPHISIREALFHRGFPIFPSILIYHTGFDIQLIRACSAFLGGRGGGGEEGPVRGLSDYITFAVY